VSADLDEALRILRDGCGDRVRTRVPLAPLTTFRVGGPAALYLEAEGEDDLATVSRAIGETTIPFTIVGKGSNILVSDEGFPGLVLRLGKGYRWAARDRDRIRAGGAMPLPALAGVALRHGLSGLEFGVAIPATLGGAVKMNAGAHDGQIGDVVHRVETYQLRDRRPVSVAADAAAFSYRGSAFPEDAVVTAATLALLPGARDAIRASMDRAREWRRRTQPLAEPNCGSVFKNPPGGHAAAMIETAELKGTRVGGAAVSTKHANFIVAGPDATASDVLALIRLVQERVRRSAGVELEPEVHLVGRFDGDAA
jgi:UDP-N-acetylmuramate dehydrogenase